MTSLTERTERALLGALLSHPAPAALDHLQSTDFASRHHGDILTAIRAASASGQGERWLDSVALAAGPLVTTRELRDMQAACAAPAHAIAYAGLVIEARTRRILTSAADGLELGSGGLFFDARRLAGVRASATGTTAVLADHMTQLAKAIRNHTAFDPGTWEPVHADGPFAAAPVTPAAPAHAWQPAPFTGQPGPRPRHEETILAGLFQHHPDSGLVLATVIPDMFTDPLRRRIYASIAAMTLRRDPVDEITLEWHIARHLAATHSRTAEAASGDTGYLAQLACMPVSEGALVISAKELVQLAIPEPAAVHKPRPTPAAERPVLRVIPPAHDPHQLPGGPAPGM